ncbi:MAG: hypothetical protein MUE87_01500 [Methanothrix sp.]|jgi:hypothetical protein|nr:hypothetical protein [Methanothrix sp.]
MRRFIISALILFAIGTSCQSIEPIVISQERGMAVLANLSDIPANQSDLNESVSMNMTNRTEGSSQINQTQAVLWSWGKIPIGYELNENGTLTRLTDPEWKPSI